MVTTRVKTDVVVQSQECNSYTMTWIKVNFYKHAYNGFNTSDSCYTKGFTFFLSLPMTLWGRFNLSLLQLCTISVITNIYLCFCRSLLL